MGRRRGAPLPPRLPPELAQIAAPQGAMQPGKTSGSGTSPMSPWFIPDEEVDQYRQLFVQMDGGMGVIEAETAQGILESSGLPVNDLFQVWEIAVTNTNGQLSMGE